MLRFAEPAWLALILIILPLPWMAKRRRRGLPVPDLAALKARARPIPRWRLWFPQSFRYVALAAVAVALARPQEGTSRVRRQSEGLDIMLVLDLSESMHAMDFEVDGERRDRLEALKTVTKSFIRARPDDRIGIVVFGSEAYTQAPLTLDHAMLEQFLNETRIGMAGRNTAIGDGLAVAMKRLKDIDAPSKIVILVTDGSNNAGSVDPLAAAEAAKTLGIKIYTIGVGSNGQAPFLVDGLFGKSLRWMRVEMDEEALKRIAAAAGGRAFLATDTGALAKVYATIDKLEKTKAERDVLIDYKELFPWPAAVALALLAAEALWLASRWRRLPA